MRFHHIGIACSDIHKAKRTLSSLYTISQDGPIVYDSLQDACVCLLKTGSGVTFELVSGAPAEGFLKRKSFYYHLCFEVEHLDIVIQDLMAAGALLFAPPKPAIVFDGRRVAFLMTEVGMVELLEGI